MIVNNSLLTATLAAVSSSSLPTHNPVCKQVIFPPKCLQQVEEGGNKLRCIFAEGSAWRGTQRSVACASRCERSAWWPVLLLPCSSLASAIVALLLFGSAVVSLDHLWPVLSCSSVVGAISCPCS
jgi:hypothetical protein